jgi:hypothetical protein
MDLPAACQLVGRRTVSGISDLHALQAAVALSRHPGAKQ